MAVVYELEKGRTDMTSENITEYSALPTTSKRFQIIADGVVHNADACIPLKDASGNITGIEFIEMDTEQKNVAVHGVVLNAPFTRIDYHPTIVDAQEFFEDMNHLEELVLETRKVIKTTPEPKEPVGYKGYM